ncbi:MAG: hypothetical protein MUC93_07155 [Bacteroidales bacterium]|nr:hypothetical protein [Bacteroidales bacterium]
MNIYTAKYQVITTSWFLRSLFIILLSFCSFIPFSSFGQQYGLEFAGQPFSKDQRTMLVLNPEGYYSFHDEFELSFSIQIRDSLIVNFGYIARITDINDRLIDIIFDGPKSHSLHVVYGPSHKIISIPDNNPVIYEKWIELRLKYSKKNNTLQFSTPDTVILDHNVDFSGEIKIFFGRNDFKQIKTTDVPRMNIKDIRIYQKGKCRHYFPLNEMTGNEVKDILSNKKGIVHNPGWIKARYYYWEWCFDTYLNGLAAVCYDPGNERVYMAGDEQLKIFSVLNDSSITTLNYSTRFTDLMRGSRVFYDTITNRLICYSLRTNTIHYFNFSELKWEKIYQGTNILERFWFHNSYYSAIDSVLYIFGGYSQHKYYNLVQQFDFKNNQWNTIQTHGDIFHPRIHAAIGNYADTLYIIGGFGSKAGDQIINPEHYTDLLAFSLKENKFIKIYDFQAPLENIDFAHSMIINEKDQSYYVLSTTIFEYETYLQLLRGTLADPKLIKLGNKFPYLFDNEFSYCDLYYSQSSQKLFAMTSLANPDKNETKITINKISSPPFSTDIETDEDWSIFGKIVPGVLYFLIVIAIAIILLKNIRKKESPPRIPKAGKENDKPEKDMLSQNSLHPDKPNKKPNSILFFGGFQIINKHGDDITKKFSPLLKELFLLIFLFSIKDKGISVAMLTELLWFSMDAKTAKNNRAVNIAKLKNLLTEIDSCKITRKTSYWRIEFNDSVVYNDYWFCIKSINQEKLISKEGLLQFLCILKTGSLLGNDNYEWLDNFKLECSDMIIDKLSHLIDQDIFDSDTEFMIQLADAILIFDPMDEQAISLKCKNLTVLGKHNHAKGVYNKFTKDYFKLYDEPFDRSFADIINHPENRKD